MTQPNDSQLAKQPETLLNLRPSQAPITPVQPQPIIVQIHQAAPLAKVDDRPAHYTTMKRREGDQPLPKLPIPNMLQATLALTVATLLLVAASMFSISLTSYSNSIDRIDYQRSPFIKNY